MTSSKDFVFDEFEKPYQLSFEKLLEMAKTFEDKGDVAKAITCYNIALGKTDDKNTKINIYEKLLEYYLNDVNPKRAIKILTNLLSLNPKNGNYYKQLIGILLEHDKVDRAKKLADIAYNVTQDKYFREIFEDKAQLYKVEEMEYDDITINLLYNLFNGREGVYARQWKNQKGDCGYIPVYEPLSEKVIKNHLQGNISVGIYQLRIDSTVTWMVFDVDVAKYALKNVLTDEKKWAEMQSLLNKQARLVQEECNKFNIYTYLEDSGYKGRHCWIFFDKPVPSRIAKKFGDLLVENIDRVSPDIVVEVFPKQNFVRKDGLGNLVKMPLGIHLKSGKRSFFYNEKGKIKDLNEYLKNVKRVSQKDLINYLSYYKVKENFDIVEKHQIKPAEKVELPVYVQKYIPENDEELQYILYKCPVLKSIYKKALNQNELSADEIVVLTHTLGYLEEGPNAVNYIFSKCYNISSDKFLKSKLNGNPISCAKIRSRLPETTSKVDCNCLFDENLGAYPSPVLHLKKKFLDKSKFIKANLDMVNIQHIIEEYLKIKKEFFEIKRLLTHYEEIFAKLFEEAGVNEINTPSGTLVKVEENGKTTFSIKL
ncbi:CRISPR-associated primase-polymerase type A1 [Deferribacter abyssi]|uniref:CRISPR-associated primase-polymerase type A1 n=1 Tax=Deferribacter abyssi TaxID=213806 RepID=UPI003C1CCF50